MITSGYLRGRLALARSPNRPGGGNRGLSHLVDNRLSYLEQHRGRRTQLIWPTFGSFFFFFLLFAGFVFSFVSFIFFFFSFFFLGGF
jgi:hypothetical protein